MKLLINLIYLLPLLIIIVELIVFIQNNHLNTISPISPENKYLSELTNALTIAHLNFQQLSLFEFRHEVEFIIFDNHSHATKMVFSTDKNALEQVGALQKLLKIANMEGREISFIDLSSTRPYATF
jgi:hypothetical protein